MKTFAWQKPPASESTRNAEAATLDRTGAETGLFFAGRIPAISSGMNGKPWDLRERSMQFAVDVYRYCRTLPGTSEARHITQQLRRAASSVAANYRARRRGKSDKDFANKLGTVIEEADESLFWLEFLVRIQLSKQLDVRALQVEAHELVAIFTACQKTARRNIKAKKAKNSKSSGKSPATGVQRD